MQYTRYPLIFHRCLLYCSIEGVDVFVDLSGSDTVKFHLETSFHCSVHSLYCLEVGNEKKKRRGWWDSGSEFLSFIPAQQFFTRKFSSSMRGPFFPLMCTSFCPRLPCSSILITDLAVNEALICIHFFSFQGSNVIFATFLLLTQHIAAYGAVAADHIFMGLDDWCRDGYACGMLSGGHYQLHMPQDAQCSFVLDIPCWRTYHLISRTRAVVGSEICSDWEV